MTPVYANPSSLPFPCVEIEKDQQLEPLCPPQQATSSVSCPIFFNSTQDQRGSYPRVAQQNQQKVDEYALHGRSSDNRAIPPSSLQPAGDDNNSSHELSLCKREYRDQSKSDDGPIKWMSSKMRLMQKMMSSSNCSARAVKNFSDQQQDNCEINAAHPGRVCADCNTTKTPLWRSGPRGPKSLCNACGIRQRKARRAMAAAANATELGTNTSMSSKVHTKEKKSRTCCVTLHRKHRSKLLASPHTGKKLSFEDFALSLTKNSAFRRVFPQDEEEAAILLMALSCGLIHS